MANVLELILVTLMAFGQSDECERPLWVIAGRWVYTWRMAANTLRPRSWAITTMSGDTVYDHTQRSNLHKLSKRLLLTALTVA